MKSDSPVGIFRALFHGAIQPGSMPIAYIGENILLGIPKARRAMPLQKSLFGPTLPSRK
jgi:hypothetical protein